MRESAPISEMLASAAATLGPVSDCARLEAETLLARAIDVSRAYLFAHPEDRLDWAAEIRLQAMLARRLAGEPIAYITGTQEFWSLELMVSPATLVPRPETELLVELALRELPRRAEKRVLDLGTGCGAIAAAIASERPLCRITAIDIDADAVVVAAENMRQLELENVACLQGDWTSPVRDRRFDMIVSNPPYVANDDPALHELRAEPDIALVAGKDGLDALRVLVRDCMPLLERDGMLLVEHGHDQAQAVAELLRLAGWEDIRCFPDYAGRPRVSQATRE